MKAFFKKWINDTLKGLGTAMLLLAILSLIPNTLNFSDTHRQHCMDIIIQFMRFFALTLPTVSMIELLIMEFELFSKKKETRRNINIIICLCVVICISNLFGIFPDEVSLIFTVVSILIVPVSAWIAYIIEDKSKKQDIIDINKKLSQLNKSK